MEEIVMAHGQVKQIAVLDAWGIVVVIFLVGRWHGNERGAELRSGADTSWYRDTGWICRAGGRRVHTVAGEAGFKLLVGAQGNAAHVRGHQRDGAICRGSAKTAGASVERLNAETGRRAGDKPAIVSPVEADPRKLLRGLILQVGCLVEMFVVVNAKNARRRGWVCTGSGDLRGKETG